MSNYKMPIREQDSNKGTFGKVLNFAGSKNYIGAAYLSTIAALKIGAGFTALATEKDIIRSVSTLLPEAIYLSRKEGLKNSNNFSVILIGCGLGMNIHSTKLFKSVMQELQKNPKPTVIDADGLNILSKYYYKLNPQFIITPHPFEAARLLEIEPNEVLNDIETSAKKLVNKYNCTVVLKTHRTVIANKEHLYINQHGNSALAKAGSGDVLAGIVSGLLAQKMTSFEAAKLGVYLHSITGEIASKYLTEYSVLASDLLKYLPYAIKKLI